MFSSAAAVSAVLLLPAVFAQSTDGTPFTAPTVTGTSCGTNQQNFNQCVTKVSKDISNCPSTGYVCLCQTYANLAACYNACPDLTDGETWKSQAHQYCAQANISDTGSVYNTTSPAANTSTASNASTTTTTTTTTTPANTANTSKTNTSSTSTTPAATASSFARNSANRCLEISSSLVVLVAGTCAVAFA